MSRCCQTIFVTFALVTNTSHAANVLYAVTATQGAKTSRLLAISNYGTVPVATDLGDTGLQLADVAIDPTSCRMYGVGYGFHEIIPGTPAPKYIGPLNGFGPPNSLEFNRSGQAYAWNPSWQFFKVNKTNGIGSMVGSVGPSAGGDLAVDVDGTMYGAAYGCLVRINQTNGTSTVIGAFDIPAVYGLEIDTDGTMYASSGTDDFKLYRIDKTTAASTLIGTVTVTPGNKPVSNMDSVVVPGTNAPAPGVNGLTFLIPAEPALPPTLRISREPEHVRLSWMCECVRNYRLLTTTQLELPIWEDFGSVVSGTTGITNVLVPTTDPARFFRLSLPED